MHTRRIILAAAAAVLACAAAPAAMAATGAAGGRDPISRAGLVPSGATDIGPAAATAKVAIRVYLNGRDPSGLQALARAVSTPGNPQYQHFLTPAQYAARFGPAPGQTAAVTSWLRGCGLTVTGVNEHYVAATGTQPAVQCAVGTPMANYRWHGRTVRAPAGTPSVPGNVAADVLTISGLSSLTPAVRPAFAAAETTAKPVAPGVTPESSATCSSYFGATPAATLPPAYGATQPWQVCGYLPSQLRSAYGVPASVTGAGTTVAVVDAYASPTMAADAQEFSSLNGGQPWAPGQYTEDVPPGLPAQPLAWTEEESTDVEAVHAIAPGADVVYVAAAGTADSDFIDALSTIVDNHLANIVSGSWVIGADTGIPTATVLAFEQVFLQGTVEGIGFDFASGDTGSQAASDDGTGPYETATNYPASDPWVTAVGGTTLAIGTSGQRTWQTGWETDYAQLSADGTSWVSPPGTFSGGSGGGPSGLFPEPLYQRGTVPPSYGNHRVVPDVAMDADPVTGMLVGQTFVLPTGDLYVQYASGGTSLATPLFAGMEAMVQQETGIPIGFANPLIYAAAALGGFTRVPPPRSPLAAVYTETTVSSTGTLVTSDVLATFGQASDAGLTITNGYDDVTGVGTPSSILFGTKGNHHGAP